MISDMPTPSHTQPVFAWSADPSLAPHAVALFLDNLDPGYISHSELQCGRADTPGQWSASLPAQLHDNIITALSSAAQDAYLKLATATIDGTLAAIAIVAIDTEQRTLHPFATLDDMVVSPAFRGMGIGQQLLDWLSVALHAQGIARLFLESGINNDKAHDFFRKQGFQTISVVMMKELG